MQKLKSWYTKNRKKILKDYFTLLQFKTISAEKKYFPEMVKCSKWLSDYLKEVGFESEIIKTKKNPLVFAQKIKDKKFKTLLIYNHYDVMPVEPIKDWKSDPFKPKIKEDLVIARGACDNKGQLFYTLTALKAIYELHNELNLNIKIIIDGEEEAGSWGLSSSLNKIKTKLKADDLLVVDMDIPSENTPAITMGVRGNVTLEAILTGSNIDLHSGSHGGLAYNPLRAVCELVSKIYKDDGSVNIDHFYDDVENTESLEKLYDLEFDEKKYKKEFQIKDLAGEKKFKGIVANWLRPTVEINGIQGGYTGEGFKTVIPSKVILKVSSRMVTKQNPEKIGKLIKEFLEKNCPKEIDIKVEILDMGWPILSEMESDLVDASIKAYEEVFGKKCKKTLAGGSVPIIGEIANKLKCRTLFMGTSILEDNIHAPNESFSLKRFEKGFYTISKILENFSKKEIDSD